MRLIVTTGWRVTFRRADGRLDCRTFRGDEESDARMFFETKVDKAWLGHRPAPLDCEMICIEQYVVRTAIVETPRGIRMTPPPYMTRTRDVESMHRTL